MSWCTLPSHPTHGDTQKAKPSGEGGTNLDLFPLPSAHVVVSGACTATHSLHVPHTLLLLLPAPLGPRYSLELLGRTGGPILPLQPSIHINPSACCSLQMIHTVDSPAPPCSSTLKPPSSLPLLQLPHSWAPAATLVPNTHLTHTKPTVVYLCCSNKALNSKQHLTSDRGGCWEIEDQGTGRRGVWKGSPSWTAGRIFSLSSQMANSTRPSCQCACLNV